MQVQTTHPNKAFWEAATLVGILLLILLVSICSLKGRLWGSDGSDGDGTDDGGEGRDRFNPREPDGPTTTPGDPPPPRDPGGDDGDSDAGSGDGPGNGGDGGGGGGGRGLHPTPGNSARLHLPSGPLNINLPGGGNGTHNVDIEDRSRPPPGIPRMIRQPTGNDDGFPLTIPQLSAGPHQNLFDLGGQGFPRQPPGPVMTPTTPVAPQGLPLPPGSPFVVSHSP